MSYLLDERTIRIMSGANLIFSAPKEQWMRVFEPLKVSADSCRSGLVETMVPIHVLAFVHRCYLYIHYLHCEINVYTLSL